MATIWRIADKDVPEFLTELEGLRLIRMSTGASGWSAYQDADVPSRITEVMRFRDWADYDRFVRNLDTDDSCAIRHAWHMDDDGQPDQLRLLRIDRPTRWKGHS